MKKSGIWIVIIAVLIAIFWYYCDSQMKKLEKEKELAIAEAVADALENARSKGVTKDPPVRTKIVYVEKETPKEKAPKKPSNAFTDARDGQQYKFIEVEGLLWMAENLNFESSASWCYSENVDNCKKWGRLYDWNTAKEVCPDGWRLPNDEEWNTLIWRFGGIETAGRFLKEGGESDFNALMAGYRDKKEFYGKADSSAYFWSATEQNDRYASFKGFYKDYANIGPYTYTKPDGFSVRCIKDK